MRALLFLSAVMGMVGCVQQSDYDREMKYVDARLAANSHDLRNLQEQLNQHLCEFHKPEYDCFNLADVASIE